MKRVELLSYPVSIFMAGDYAMAIAACQEFCDQWPLCVTVTPTRYVYRDGAEDGVIVGLIHYPRFPSTPDEIWRRAEEVAHYLRPRLGQQSYTIQAPDKTVWFSHRPEDNKPLPNPSNEGGARG